MEAKVTWQDRMSFSGTAESGFSVPLGSHPSVGGDDDGFRPMELLAISLAGCTAMDVISILQKKRQQVSGFDVRVQAEQSKEHPHVFTSAAIQYHVAGTQIEESAVLRSIELSATRYCPVQAMMRPALPIRLLYFIYEGDSLEAGTLVKQGEYLFVSEMS